MGGGVAQLWGDGWVCPGLGVWGERMKMTAGMYNMAHEYCKTAECSSPY